MSVLTCNYYSKARFGMQQFTAVMPIDPPPVEGKPVPYEGGPWPTIYLLHGYSGNQLDWLLRSDIEIWAARYGYAIIMPSGANSFYLDNDTTKELFGAHIGEELVSVTRKLFPLCGKREDTVIAGLSMGGFGAVRNGLRYSDTFGAILALSSALITDMVANMTPETAPSMAPFGYYRHTFGDFNALLGSDKDPKFLAKKALGEKNPPLMFLACGSEDFLIKDNVSYHEYLDSLGYPHEWWVRPGVHDFEFWNQALPAGLAWLEEQRKQ